MSLHMQFFSAWNLSPFSVIAFLGQNSSQIQSQSTFFVVHCVCWVSIWSPFTTFSMHLVPIVATVYQNVSMSPHHLPIMHIVYLHFLTNQWLPHTRCSIHERVLVHRWRSIHRRSLILNSGLINSGGGKKRDEEGVSVRIDWLYFNNKWSQITVNCNHNGLFSSMLHIHEGSSVALYYMTFNLLLRLIKQPLPGRQVVCRTENREKDLKLSPGNYPSLSMFKGTQPVP